MANPPEGFSMRLTTNVRRSGWLSGTVARLLLFMILVLSAIGPPEQPARAQQDVRYFADTGYRVDDDKVWDYFQKRGGSRTFGLPISRTFPFMGLPTQFFQRHVLQVASDGVHTLNLLDDGVLPYTTINGLTLPSVDAGMVSAAPKTGSADYGSAAVAYVKKTAPDTFDGDAV